MEEVDKNKKLYILLGLLLIVTFAIVTNLIKSKLNSKIDYNSDDVVADLLKSATLTYDREVYFVMEDIITKYINSYSSVDFNGEQASYEEYYDLLDEAYKDKLGKNKYKENAEKFFRKVEYQDKSSMDVQTEYITTNIIRAIYDLGKNKYLCAIGFIGSTEYGYIGISINTSKKTYEIFYLK